MPISACRASDTREYATSPSQSAAHGRQPASGDHGSHAKNGPNCSAVTRAGSTSPVKRTKVSDVISIVLTIGSNDVLMKRWSGRVLAALLCLSALALLARPTPWLPGARLPALDRLPLALLLLLLAHGLAGRRRLALQMTVALLVIAIVPPVHRRELVLPLVAGLLLLPGRYPVRPDSQRLRTATVVAGG